MDYFEKQSYKVKRELINVVPSRSNNTSAIYSFETFEEAFDRLEKMYKMDKALYDYITKVRGTNTFFDESKELTSYTFSINNSLLTVKILDIDKIAREVFGLEALGFQKD